jgi:hypothetical protein
MNNRHLAIFSLVLLFALIFTFSAFAQGEPTPTPTTPVAFDLGAIVASLLVYLGYLAGLATACQAAINKAKPVILDPLCASLKLDDNGRLIEMYIAQALFAVIGFMTLGWVEPVKVALAPVLSVLPIPDGGVIVLSLVLVVASSEVIYGLIKGLRGFQDSLSELGTSSVPTTR